MKIVFRYVFKYEKAVDVVNDGFVKVFRNFANFICKDDTNLEKILMGWMKRIMVNTAIDELRKQNQALETGNIPENVWEEPDKHQNADQLLIYKELICEVIKLPPSYRTVFNMYVIDGFSHQEIADRLGISVGTSKSSLSKARIHLQKFLKPVDVCKI